MNYKTLLLRSAFALTAVSLIPAGQAFAQASGASTLEEVVVTARKREESLQSIPVAVTAQTGVQLERQTIQQPSDLGRIVPGLTVPQNSNAKPNIAFFRLRGQVSADNLLTLSQAVGMYIDSVNVPHPVAANGSFFDLTRVEVLKGPQGTLYGRNTTGGAVNIITRNADSDGIHGFVQGELTNYSGKKLTAAVNVPIAGDMLAVRLAGQYWKRDGYGHSRITGDKYGGDRDDANVRATVNFNPTDNFSAVLKGELGRSDRIGNFLTILHLQTTGAASTAFIEGNLVEGSPAGLNLLQSCVGGDLFESCQGSKTFEKDKTRHLSLDMNWDITDNIRLRSITGYHWFTVTSWFDIDASPWQLGESSGGIGGLQPLTGLARPPATARLPDGAVPSAGPYLYPFNIRPDQQSGQWTQEFNLSGSAWDDRFKWLVGAFGSDDKGKGVQISTRNPAINTITAPFYAPTPNSFEGLDVTSRTWAFYTQDDLKFSDVVSVTLGVRYTEERLGQLNASWRFNQNYEHANTPLSGLGQNYECLYGPLGAAAVADQYGPIRLADYQATYQACGLKQTAKFSGTSYMASLNLQFTPDMLTYFKLSRGFRGGALQLRAPQVPAVSPEIADDYEIGFKADFFERRLRTNLAVYQTNYNNAQFTFVEVVPPGIRTTVLRNAASVRMRGAELEARFIPMEGLSIGGNLSYLDAHYLRFPNAPSPIGPVNAAGFQLEQPVWNGDLNARYETDIGGGRLGIQADYSYASKTPFTALSQEPAVPDTIEQSLRKTVGLVNARVEYAVPDMGLTVAVYATNLLNKHYAVPGLSAGSNGGILTANVRDPRIWGVSLRKSFGNE